MFGPLRQSLSPIVLPAVQASSGGGGGGTAALTSSPSGATRNNFGPFVGFGFVPTVDIYVKSIGRWVVSGNTLTHTVKLANGGPSSTDVPGASVTIATSGVPAGYVYAVLGASIHLVAGTQYYCVSGETIGGDVWYNLGAFTPSGHISALGSVYGNNSGWNYSADGSAYVPPNFLYDLTP